jgi:ABC-type polysaccharide/polyol phosphate export permease
MTIFSIIFGNLVKIPSDGVPYPVFVYGFGWSTVSAIAIFSLGTWIFRSAEEGFADYI